MRCLALITFGLAVLLSSTSGTAQDKPSRKIVSKAQQRAAGLKPADADVRYGEHPRNVFDVYKVEANSPTAVLIYFHGGGFVAGDKSNARRLPLARTCLDNGITVISANYRFVAGPDSEPFPGSLMDGVRVVQFVRANAKRWNIDPQQVVVSGDSAGGLMSIWLGVHDDFADADNADPVKRQSSRALGVIGYGAQSTIDPAVILKEIGGNPDIHPSIFPIYGVKKIGELSTPALRLKVNEFSSLTHVTQDDPPMLLRYGGTLAGTPLPPDANVGVSIHHATFGELLRKRYEQSGTKSQIQVTCSDCPDREATEIDFLRRVLKLENSPSE